MPNDLLVGCRVRPSFLTIASAALLTSSALAVGTFAETVADRTLVVRNATIIDTTGGPPIHDAVIVLRGARIESVGSPSGAGRPHESDTLDADGRFVIPGLINLHQHVVSAVAQRQWLAYGVTSIRDPGADLARVRPMRADIDAGGRLGPRLFLGLLVDADAGQTPESVRRMIAEEAERGIDLVKLYLRTPLADARAAIEEAHARGLPVTWHLGPPLSEALDLATDGVEHLYLFRELMPEPTGEAPRTTGAAFARIYARWARHLDPTSLPAQRLFRRLAEQRTVWTPTLALAAQIARGQSDYAAGWTAADIALALKGFEAACRMVGEAHRLGVRIGAGTDTEDPSDLHRELALLVSCGLSPTAALGSATAVAASALRRDGVLGAVQPGALADLLVLDANPTVDIRNTTKIWRVIKNGQVLDPRTLRQGRE